MSVCNCHGMVFLDCPNYKATRIKRRQRIAALKEEVVRASTANRRAEIAWLNASSGEGLNKLLEYEAARSVEEAAVDRLLAEEGK